MAFKDRVKRLNEKSHRVGIRVVGDYREGSIIESHEDYLVLAKGSHTTIIRYDAIACIDIMTGD